MSDEKVGAEFIGEYHIQVRVQAKEARIHYYKTGEPISIALVPHLLLTWQAAMAAVAYARRISPLAASLPKRFDWLGSQYQLVFPPEGPVLIADPLTQENLCVGMPGWVDPMKATRKKKL